MAAKEAAAATAVAKEVMAKKATEEAVAAMVAADVMVVLKQCDRTLGGLPT
jgi:hypothetical protein